MALGDDRTTGRHRPGEKTDLRGMKMYKNDCNRPQKAGPFLIHSPKENIVVSNYDNIITSSYYIIINKNSNNKV